MLIVILAETALAACGRREQSGLLVIPDGLDIDAGPLAETADIDGGGRHGFPLTL